MIEDEVVGEENDNDDGGKEDGDIAEAIEDAKVFYLEAMTAQPGNHDQMQVDQTLWRETQLGAGLFLFYEGFRAHPTLHPFARLILPRTAVRGTTG